MNIRNPKHNAVGTFDCEIEHETLGWIPFTASPDDTEETGRNVHAAILAGEAGGIAPYVAPVPTREEVDEARKAAYADPSTGSDRLFAEAQRMNLMGEPGWEAKRDAAVARYNEIQASLPWPEEA
ncbi:hypothetical protein [Ectopseudomonas oleovorans]|uniref:Uncharacterized protein n=1 Tax=Ectopseudomonas oleovorans TaxID=301 RepID=A0AA42QGE4_ECTOL|nr:hypothetical protein [Pseudomonas oleovorans]MDH1340568.1 hypothetical protein [Pseudomonas oleovorans]MDH1491540.1 hypothetical protein [Pseudomonas oleovorans]WGG22415.1 hypothetical protein N5O83_07020 [Pseudomonas oleovorans]